MKTIVIGNPVVMGRQCGKSLFSAQFFEDILKHRREQKLLITVETDAELIRRRIMSNVYGIMPNNGFKYYQPDESCDDEPLPEPKSIREIVQGKLERWQQSGNKNPVGSSDPAKFKKKLNKKKRK